MREYECLFIIDPNKEDSLKEITNGIAGGIAKSKGRINKEENWGKQQLSYPIKKHKDGIYYKLNFSVDPSEISALKNNYKLNADILRVMLTVK